MTLCLIHQQHCEETFDASYSQGLKGMMCHNKIDLIPLKLSSIIMNLLTPFICYEFSETPLYTLLETMDCPENQNQNPQNYLMSAPPPPPLPGEKIMTGPLDLNRRFSRGEGGGGGLQILLIFFYVAFHVLRLWSISKLKAFFIYSRWSLGGPLLPWVNLFVYFIFFCFFLQSFPSLLKMQFSSFFVMFQCF